MAFCLLSPNTNAAQKKDPARFPKTVRKGQTCLLNGTWFRYLGQEKKRRCWLYPHLDGVPEIFLEAPDGVWKGHLGSAYESGIGRFKNLFNAAEVLNEFLYFAPKEQRRNSACLLALYLKLHPAAKPPYYLRPHLNNIERILIKEDRQWVADHQRFHQRMLNGLPKTGLKIPNLDIEKGQRYTPSAYYLRMIEDGYLDIAVVGGNLMDERRGTYNSWRYMETFRKNLEQDGFRTQAFRSAEDKVLTLKKVSILGHTVVVRILITGGSTRPHRINRSVANFVEGLAHADIFLFHGHSNRTTGSYYLSESGIPFSRFQIGLNDQSDLALKCHGLMCKPYQILGLQSCWSYKKYAAPIDRYFREKHAHAPGAGFTGHLGNAGNACQYDFVPRYGQFLKMILAAKGPKEILLKLNAIRPDPITPNMIMRGLLQPRRTFILPKDVTLTSIDEADSSKNEAQLVLGHGSDGQTYFSTGIFAQNHPKEIVQVLFNAPNLFGLMQDGRIFMVGPATLGAMVETALTRDQDHRFQFMGSVRRLNRTYLLLVGQDGRLYEVNRQTGQPSLYGRQPPKGTSFECIGENEQGEWMAQDTEKHWYKLRKGGFSFTRTEAPASPPLFAPHLLGKGRMGLWRVQAPAHQMAPKGKIPPISGTIRAQSSDR